MLTLSEAAREGDVEAVKSLLENNADINQRTRKGTPLIEAIEFNHEEVVEVLLQHPNINVNMKTQLGHTALHMAIRNCLQSSFDGLLERTSTNVNLQNQKGNTPLITAVRYKNHYALKALLARPEIKVNMQNNWKNTAVLWAMKKGRENLVLLLLTHPNINVKIKGEDGKSILEMGKAKNKLDLIKRLKHRQAQKSSPMHIRQASQTLCVKNGLALIAAIQGNREQDIERLLSLDMIDVNAQNQSGNTPLISAVRHNKEHIVELLLAQKDIDVNIKNNFGNTALLWAARKNRIDLCKHLVAHEGIDLFLSDEDKLTVFDYSKTNKKLCNLLNNDQFKDLYKSKGIRSKFSIRNSVTSPWKSNLYPLHYLRKNYSSPVVAEGGRKSNYTSLDLRDKKGASTSGPILSGLALATSEGEKIESSSDVDDSSSKSRGLKTDRISNEAKGRRSFAERNKTSTDSKRRVSCSSYRSQPGEGSLDLSETEHGAYESFSEGQSKQHKKKGTNQTSVPSDSAPFNDLISEDTTREYEEGKDQACSQWKATDDVSDLDEELYLPSEVEGSVLRNSFDESSSTSSLAVVDTFVKVEAKTQFQKDVSTTRAPKNESCHESRTSHKNRGAVTDTELCAHFQGNALPRQSSNPTLETVKLSTQKNLSKTPGKPSAADLTPVSVEEELCPEEIKVSEKLIINGDITSYGKGTTGNPRPPRLSTGGTGISRGVIILSAIAIIVVCIFGYNFVSFQRQPGGNPSKGHPQGNERPPGPRRIPSTVLSLVPSHTHWENQILQENKSY